MPGPTAATGGHSDSDTVYVGHLGDGSGGAITRSSSGTESTILICTSYTVNTGVARRTGSQPLFCSGTVTLTGTGTYHNDGNNGSGTTAGTAVANAHLGGSAAGGAGGTGGGNGSNGGSLTTAYGGNGGAGGGGGVTGGSGGTATAPGANFIPVYAGLPYSKCGSLFDGSATQVRWSPGAGGGGGGSGGAGSGGGGGSGAGAGLVVCNAFVGAGNYTAKGGNGANADVIDDGGGGGSGGGGGLLLTCPTANVTGTFTSANNCPAGTVGTGNGVGASGSSGAAGKAYLVPA